MRYLKLYEAFESKGISNTLKFLKEKVGNESAKKFVMHLNSNIYLEVLVGGLYIEVLISLYIISLTH